MASIHREVMLNASAQQVWDAARDPAALDTRLVPGFVRGTHFDGDIRTVTFANGFVARERIVDVDDTRRRIAWSVVDSPRLTHHNASLQVFEEGDRARAVWIADLMPHELAPEVTAMIELGLAAMQRAFASPAA